MEISRRDVLSGIPVIGMIPGLKPLKDRSTIAPRIHTVVNLYGENYLADSKPEDKIRELNRKCLIFSGEMFPVQVYIGRRSIGPLYGLDEIHVIREQVLDRKKRLRLRAGPRKVEIVRNIVDEKTLLGLACEKEYKQRALTGRFSKINGPERNLSFSHKDTTYNIFGFPEFIT